MVSSVLLLVIVAVGLLALAVAGVVGFTASSRGGTPADISPPRSDAGGRRTLALRLEGVADVSFAQALVERHGGRCEAQVGDVAVDLMRLAPTATHFYLGPAVATFRTDLPDGLVIQLDVEPMGGDGDGLAGAIAALRGLGAPRFARLAVATPGASGAALVAVDEDERPGHRRCRHCRHAFVVSEFQCPNCGAGAEAP